MSEATLQYRTRCQRFTNRRSLHSTYSKKIGMWLFLMSDSLTFGALLYAYSYGRISTPNWPTPFHSESIVNATIMTAFLLTSSLTMVLAVRASAEGNAKSQRLWLLATMACGMGFVILHGREWTKLIAEGLSLPVFPKPPGFASTGEYANVVQNVPQFPATFFGLTGMHMLHVTLGVVYLGIVALRRYFIPILLVFWLAACILALPPIAPFITAPTFCFSPRSFAPSFSGSSPRFTIPPTSKSPGSTGISSIWSGCLFSRWCI